MIKEKISANVICIICLFILMFLCTIPYLSADFFIDEADNYLGGLEVSRGGVVYKDFYSQHTPMMYYIAGIFALFGIKSIIGFRICFYTLLTVIILLIYLRNKKYIGKATILFGFLFLIDLCLTMRGTTILSEHMQSLAIIALFMEFYRYTQEKLITIKSAIIIILTVLFSIGTAFVSVYPVACIVAGVIIFEISEVIEAKFNKEQYDFKQKIKSYSILIVVGVIAITIFLGYFVINDALRDFYYQSDVFNREVYSQYNGGLGDSIVGAVIDCIKLYINYFKNSISNFSTPMELRNLIMCFTNIGFIMYLFKKKYYIALVALGVIITTGIRDFIGFHAIPYFAISWFGVALLIKEYIKTKKQIICICITFAVCFSSYIKLYPEAIVNLKYPIISQYDEYVDKYTEKNDYIYNCFVNPKVYFTNKNNCRPAVKCLGGLCPWFTDIFMQEFINDIEAKQPKIIFYNPDWEVWKYKYSSFCMPIQDLLEERYINLADTLSSEAVEDNEVWIRKDLLEIYDIEIKNNI